MTKRENNFAEVLFSLAEVGPSESDQRKPQKATRERQAGAKEVPQPFPYQGSKRTLARRILAHFPRDVATLIEPFAGSAAISLAAAYHHAAPRFLISDANCPLMDLWMMIRDEPERLAQQYDDLWNDQLGREATFYVEVRDRFNKHHQPADFLYLLARCVKAAVRYNSNGEFNQSPDNRRRGARPRLMRLNILSASRLLAGKAEIVSQDYRDALRVASPGDVVYMDPPYQGVCGARDSRYKERLACEAFIESLRELNERRISYIVSYDGRTGTKTFGETLPESLNLVHLELDAGRSSQSTLLGGDDHTIESLYLSEALVERKKGQKPGVQQRVPVMA